MQNKKKIWIPSVSAVIIAAVVLLITLNPFQAGNAAEAESIKDQLPTVSEEVENAASSAAAIAEEAANTEQEPTESEPVTTQTDDSTQTQQTSNSTPSTETTKPAPAPIPAPKPAPIPAPDPNAGKTFLTICTCGATFANANEWDAHRESFKEKWYNEEITKAEMDLHNGYSQRWQ